MASTPETEVVFYHEFITTSSAAEGGGQVNLQGRIRDPRWLIVRQGERALSPGRTKPPRWSARRTRPQT